MDNYTLITKKDYHYNKYIVDKTKEFALLVVCRENFVSAAIGEPWNDGTENHWFNKPLVTKKDLQIFAKEKHADMEKAGIRFVWAKASSMTLFYECDENDIPDDSTTEVDKFLVFFIDEYGDKTMDENPIMNKFQLTKHIGSLSRKISDLETHWRYKDPSKIPEIYEMEEALIIHKLEHTWSSYRMSDEFVYNAKVYREILDTIKENKRATGNKCWECVTLGELTDYIFDQIDNLF